MNLKAKTTLFVALALSLLGFSSASLAGGSLDLSLSNYAFRVGYDATHARSNLHLGASWLHHEDEGDMGTLGLHVVDTRPGARNVYVGVGVMAHIADLALWEETAGGVGVGGFARYAIPANRDFSLAGYAYYGPSVLAFEDTKNLINTDFRFQYSPIPTARIYIGYRYVSFKQEGYRKRYELADGGHGGISIDF